MSTKAYSYIRFSTPEQIKGDSLRRQTEFSEEYAAEHGLVLDSNLRLKDLGLSAYSGKHRDRGALGVFLKLVENGKIEKGSVLLVESLDRLSREEITEALEQFLAIIRKGIKIVTLADRREYTKETINANVGELIVSLTIMSRAHEESATKAMRLGKAWEGKRKAIGTKKLTGRCPGWLNLSDDKTEFTIIGDRRKAIRRIFDMKLAGKGVTAITKELNRISAWKPGIAGWRESYVKKILQNPAVIGEFQPHRMVEKKRQPVGDPISDYFPAVIDKDIFYRVQGQFRQNKYKGGQTGRVNNLFTHLVKCGHCGGPMAFVDKGPTPKGGKYLVCDQARRGLDCCKASIKYDDVELFVLNHCRGLKPEDIINENNDTARTLVQNDLDGKAGELNSISLEIENLTDSISTTPDKRVRERLERRMIEKLDKQDELNKTVSNLRRQLDTLNHSLKDTQQNIEAMGKLMDVLRRAKGDKLVDVRLKLRNELKKLIQVISITTAAFPTYTIADMKRDMKLEKKYFPKGTAEYAKQEAFFQNRLENPQDDRYISILYRYDNQPGISDETIAKRKRRFPL